MSEKTQEIQDVKEATTQDLVISDLKKSNLTLKEKIRDLEIRGLEVYKENNQLKASNEISEKMALLEYQLKLAEHFVQSNALPVQNAAQAYVIMKAGEEIGLKEMEAIKSLYIVRGQVSAWGMGMVSILTGKGYEVSFTDEDKNGVTVTVMKNQFIESYRVNRTDNELINSKAMGFASKNKMRYHGIRQIIKFHLAHLFGSVSLDSEDDIEAAEKRLGTYDEHSKVSEDEETQIIANLDNAENTEELKQYFNSLDKIQRTVKVTTAFKNTKIKLIKEQQQIS